MTCRCAAGPTAMTTAYFSESHSEFLIVTLFTCNYILWKSNYNLNQHFWLRVTERTIRSLRAGPDDGAVVEEEVIAKATSWRLKESADRRVKVTWGRRFLSEHTPVVTYETVFFTWTWAAETFGHFLSEMSIIWLEHRRTNMYEWKRKVTFIHVSVSVCSFVYSRYPWKPSLHDSQVFGHHLCLNSGSSEILLHRPSN